MNQPRRRISAGAEFFGIAPVSRLPEAFQHYTGIWLTVDLSPRSNLGPRPLGRSNPNRAYRTLLTIPDMASMSSSFQGLRPAQRQLHDVPTIRSIPCGAANPLGVCSVVQFQRLDFHGCPDVGPETTARLLTGSPASLAHGDTDRQGLA